MAKFNEYPSKATPEDNDTLMLYDAATKSNKLSPFSGIWNWMVGKLTNAVIANLQTNNKTVLGAINELNSNSFRWTRIDYPNSDKPLEKLNSPSLIFGTGKILPYTLIFVDNEGDSDLNGGVSIVYGFMYEDDRYGAQIAMHYSGTIRKRNKNDNVWSEWTAIHN